MCTQGVDLIRNGVSHKLFLWLSLVDNYPPIAGQGEAVPSSSEGGYGLLLESTRRENWIETTEVEWESVESPSSTNDPSITDMVYRTIRS
ncbi:hypothetical protein VNO77_22959 [Canavalia gladiata]|uniref:Uncharacterized protein n=1 Tax=Canavalia gladiata TaxID=3824 RepID=A0AAN9QEY7_CANGL